jgi:hypothetical protein
MSYALGSAVPLAITIRDGSGTPTPATVTCTITLPDGTSTSPDPSSDVDGIYYVDYTATQPGRYLVHWSATGDVAAAYNDVFEVDAAEIQPICSLADIKAHLNIPATTTTNDAEMLNMALAMSDVIEAYLGFPIRRRTVTELYDGDTDALCLRTTPCPCSSCAQYSILTVLSVTENTVPLTQGTDYVLDARRGILRRGQFGGLYGYNWTWIYVYAEGISVTYTTGYPATPPWARQAFLRAMANSWQRTQNRPHPGISQGAMSDEMPAQNPYALPYHVTAILQPHKGGVW